jgi:hypothetical protein
MELSNSGYLEALDGSKSTATEIQGVAINTGLCDQVFDDPEMESGLTGVDCILAGSSPVDMSSASGPPDVRFDETVSLNQFNSSIKKIQRFTDIT